MPVVLVACGSFSPITYLHLRMFETAKDWLHFNKPEWQVVGGYLSPVSDGYGKKGLIAAAHRRKICEIAVETSDWIMVDPWESLKAEWMTTRQVLQHVKVELNAELKAKGYQKEVRPMLLCGADLVESFLRVPPVWSTEDIDAILRDFGIVVLERPPISLTSLIYSSTLLWQHEKDFMIVPQFISNDVSSTKIRQLLERGCSIRYLTPDAVIDYVYQNNLLEY